jgi:hypothetical protein
MSGVLGPPVSTVYWFIGSVASQDWNNASGNTPAEKIAALQRAHFPEFHRPVLKDASRLEGF